MEIQEVNDLIPIVWENQRVLISKQVAKAYGTTTNVIKENFRRSKEYFEEGVHYFKLTGEELRELKAQFNEFRNSDIVSPVPKMANCLYLWTYQGCVRHCKMINTPEAWKMFDVLERVYFGVIKGEMPAPAEVAPPAAPEVLTLKEEVIRLQNQIAKPCTDFAVVYVLLMSNGTVKIGMTKDLTDRVKQLKAETGLFVLDFDSTKFMPREDAVALEAALKEKFAPYAMGGEFFDVRFRDVIAQL